MKGLKKGEVSKLLRFWIVQLVIGYIREGEKITLFRQVIFEVFPIK